MKVLHVIAAYKPAYVYGGPTMSVAALCEELVKADVYVEVFATTANGLAELDVTVNKPTVVDGVPVTYFKRLTKDHTHFSPMLLRSVRRRANEFDAIHIHAWWNLVSLFACFIALAKGVPVVLSPRGTLSKYSFTNKNVDKKGLIHCILGKRLLKKCHIHVTSAHEGDAIQQLVKPLSITNIANFVTLGKATYNASQMQNDQLKLLFFSRIEEKKGLDILLNALNSVAIPFSLTIAGTGDVSYVEHLKGLVANTAFHNKIHWIGFVGEEKFDLLQQHDLLVLPSYDENFGNVVIESLSVGTAVLVSEHVGLADYVKEKNLGWVCQTNQVSVSTVINDIYNTHKSDLGRIRENAPRVIKADFSAENLVHQYINFYNKIITA